MTTYEQETRAVGHAGPKRRGFHTYRSFRRNLARKLGVLHRWRDQPYAVWNGGAVRPMPQKPKWVRAHRFTLTFA